jgi:hypothetical protein
MHRETYQKLKEKTKLNIDWSNSEKTKKKKNIWKHEEKLDLLQT